VLVERNRNKENEWSIMRGTASIVIIRGVNRKFTLLKVPRQWSFLLVVKVGWRQKKNLCEVKKLFNI
jgi:hypothetical protein